MQFILIIMLIVALTKKSQNTEGKNLKRGEKKQDTQWVLVIKV